MIQTTMPTIRDVAKACGVSPMTVSFVLNDKREQVSEETRERVLKAVREMGYRPKAAERHRKAPPVLTLGLVTGVSGESLVTSGYYTDLLRGLVPAADQLGHNLTLFTDSLFRADIHRSIRVYCDGRCDGLLLVAPSIGNPVVPALHERGIPFVLVGDTGADLSLPCADLDNLDAGRQATQYLLAQGHRRIAFFGGPNFVTSALERQHGFRQALDAAGLAVQPDWVLANIVYPQQETVQIHKLMAEPEGQRPTAFFCWNDGAGHKAIATLQEMGIAVPKAVSVISIDDDSLALSLKPLLTTFRQPYSEIASRAIQILAAQIRHDTTQPHRALLPAELIVRESVAAPLA